MMKFGFTLSILQLFFSVLTIAQDANPATSATRAAYPNVVLILADDQGWGDLSLHGNKWIETPHLDGLAKSGVRFNNFYVSPLCAPSRASILTGRYHLSTGVISVSKGMEIMDTNENTLAELFKANGYKTGIFGKWHNGQHYPNRPNDQGFDEFLGFCAGHWSNYFDTELDHNGKLVKTKGYITDILTDAAIEFIGTDKQQPFFCYIPYNAPHSPHQVADKYFNKYKLKGLDDEIASIYGMVDNMDENIGRIIDHLKKNNLEANTIIIFLSDNGPNSIRYNGEMKGIKGSVHEGGVKVPFFIAWKNKIPSGKIVSSPAAHIDLYPTLLDLCKLNSIPGRPIDGINLSPIVLGNDDKKASERKLFTHVNFMQIPVTLNSGGFRSGQYRFVFEKNGAQLYDLSRDPSQLNDLSSQMNRHTDEFSNNYRQWFTSVSSGIVSDRSTILSQTGVELPVTEAIVTTGIKFKEGHAWAHDWVEKWNTTQDSIYWEIDCINPGNYAIKIAYLCKPGDEGSRIECSLGESKKEVSVYPSFYSKQIPSPDRIVRKEAYEMTEWNQLSVGTFLISKGKHRIKIKALKLANENIAEIKSITVQPANE